MERSKWVDTLSQQRGSSGSIILRLENSFLQELNVRFAQIYMDESYTAEPAAAVIDSDIEIPEI